jgi:AbrB family looped-hinge helix DNA binding protein
LEVRSFSSDFNRSIFLEISSYIQVDKKSVSVHHISYNIIIDKQNGGTMQTTISSKYQVVIPKPARERLHLRPKQKLTVIEKDGMLILIPHTSLESLRGIAAGASTDDYREKKDRIE